MDYRLGIDLGGTNIAAGIVFGDGRLAAKASVPCHPERGAESVMADMAAASRLAAENAGISLSDVAGGGVGIPGVVDRGRGTVLLAANLGWNDVDVRSALTPLLGFFPAIGNDADCAALGECRAGSGSRFGSMLLITIGTGIGGGITSGGRLSGGNGCGEIGHMVIELGGEPCACGRRGCFERYASASALAAQTRAAAAIHPDSKIWQVCGGRAEEICGKTAFDAAELGDETAREVVSRYTDYLAEGTANLINILRPEAVVFGGGVSRQGEALFAPLRERLVPLVYAADRLGMPEICAAALGNDAGIIGAALLD